MKLLFLIITLVTESKEHCDNENRKGFEIDVTKDRIT